MFVKNSIHCELLLPKRSFLNTVIPAHTYMPLMLHAPAICNCLLTYVTLTEYTLTFCIQYNVEVSRDLLRTVPVEIPAY